MQLFRFALAFALASSAGMCESGVLGPTLGFARLESQLRPLLGLPGAAHWGAPVDLGARDVLALCPVRGYVILGGAKLSIADLKTGASYDLDGWPEPPLAISLSPQGTSAALVSAGRVDVLTGLPAEPRAAARFDIDAAGARLAVSDDGQAILLARGDSLTRIDAQGESRMVAAGEILDVRFRPGSSSSYLYTDGLSVAVLGQDSATLLAAADSIPAARLAAFSADGKYIVVLNAAPGELLVAEAAGGRLLSRVPLPCSPAGLESLNEAAMRFHCGAASRSYLIDLAGPAARLLFVPEPLE